MSELNREEVLRIAALILANNMDTIHHTSYVTNHLSDVVDMAEELIKEVDSRDHNDGMDLSKFGVEQNN